MLRHEAAIGRLRKREELVTGEMTAFMTDLAGGILADGEICEFLTLLREKGETAPDITEAARVLRTCCVRLPTGAKDLLDTCGTGGDGFGTLNVSTIAAIAAAAAGVPVAKHGNRSVSGTFGSADLLEALGIKIMLTPDETAACLAATGFAFLFAPLFHPAVKAAAGARQKIKGRTLFNLLGPLANPAGAAFQLLGVYDRKLVEPVARSLGDLGTRRGIVVHGEEGLDEVSISGRTFISEWSGGGLESSIVEPEDFGLKRAPLADVRCAAPEEALGRAREVIEGRPGPAADFVLLNAAFALRAADHTRDVAEGIRRLRELLKEGALRRKVESIRSFTQSNVDTRRDRERQAR